MLLGGGREGGDYDHDQNHDHDDDDDDNNDDNNDNFAADGNNSQMVVSSCGEVFSHTQYPCIY